MQIKEIEKKWLISWHTPGMPLFLRMAAGASRTKICQTYLERRTFDGAEWRVRKRGVFPKYEYSITEKIPTKDRGTRIERERDIWPGEYRFYKKTYGVRQIVKNRWTFDYNGQRFELDEYPGWKDRAILELELTDINQAYEIPPFIEVIRDVTDEPAYKNSAIAKPIIRPLRLR